MEAPDATLGGASTLHLTQTLLREGATAPLTVVTRHAHRIFPESKPCDPVQSLVWGFASALREEHPELPHRLIDLDDAMPEETAAALWKELGAAGAEDRLAWRDGARYAQRLARRTPPPATPYRLHPSSTGTLDQMVVKPFHALAPGSREVLIRVRATGLNFRDVINALGMLPGNAGCGRRMLRSG